MNFLTELEPDIEATLSFPGNKRVTLLARNPSGRLGIFELASSQGNAVCYRKRKAEKSIWHPQPGTSAVSLETYQVRR